jgi:CTP synthase
VNLEWIHSETLTNENVNDKLKDLQGILVAPGFGSRGISGKISAVKFARENKVPFLGICLGMQCAVIEFARNVLGWKDAHTAEIDKESGHPVIDLMEEQKSVTEKGGTMRLGSYKCKVLSDTNLSRAYNQEIIDERHRHRFEFNSDYLKDFEDNGMIASGKNPETGLVEVIEIPEHPWFVGVQYHPEYKSTVSNPQPIFKAFVKAVLDNK